MTIFRASVAVVVSCVTAACILQNGQRDSSVGVPNSYLGAGVFAATAVGATAVNRKVTGDCYAACPTGYACNRDSGLCDRIACACPADQICEIVGGQVVCTQPHRALEDARDAASDADADAADPR